MSAVLSEIDVIQQRDPLHTGTVIFLHGSGYTGAQLKSLMKYFRKESASFPHLKILIPTASLKPYTPLDGKLSHVWFDRLGITPSVPECLDSINATAEELQRLINEEVEKGIPRSRIIIGGFSMGGAMAMYMGYRFEKELAGVFALSSFLNDGSAVYQELAKNKDKIPSLFYCHGDRDDLVPLECAQTTFNQLKTLGVHGEFHILGDVMHKMKNYEINMLYDWIRRILPEP